MKASKLERLALRWEKLTKHPRVRKVVRATDFVPLRWSGVVMLAFLGLLFYYVGYMRQDLVLTVTSIALLGLCMLLIVGVTATFWILSRRIKAHQAASPGVLKLQGLVGQPFLIQLDVSIPYVPLVETEWRWTEPSDGEVNIVKTVDGPREEVRFRRRCLVNVIERLVEVRDVLGVASLRRRFRSDVQLEVLPVPLPLDAQTLVTSLHPGEDIADPMGEPIGDRMDMRRYAAGDPPRFILWKVYARSGKLMVRIPERALSPVPRTCAYLVAGSGDEEAAGLARSLLEKGVLGAGWRFGADGSENYATTIEESLTLLARSGNPLAGVRPLQGFLEQARRDGFASCLVLLPSGYGPWVEEVEKALRAGGLQVSLLAVDAIEEAGPKSSLLGRVPQLDRLSKWVLSPPPDFQGKEPKKVLTRLVHSGHRSLIYMPATGQVRKFTPLAAAGLKKG